MPDTLPTPFCEDDTIDCGSLEREVNFLLDSGVSGIALFGNASEAFALTAAEKQQIAELVVRVNNGRVPLVFGAGGTGIEPADLQRTVGLQKRRGCAYDDAAVHDKARRTAHI